MERKRKGTPGEAGTGSAGGWRTGIPFPDRWICALHQPEFSLYRAIREAVPVVDAAVLKLVRLAGGVGVTCQDKEAERALNHFLRTVPVGWNQKGIQAFLDSYLDCLLTCGRAVGEIVPSRDGRWHCRCAVRAGVGCPG
ncbi:MAG: hypothetical protein ACLT9P_06060 [Evtepia gabavorous]